MSPASALVHLVILAKEPVPGQVKTRLSPPLSLPAAAAVAEAALADTLQAVLNTPAGARTLVLDGEPGRWLADGFAVLPQRGHGLDERLAAGLSDAYALARLPVLLIGMDTPQVTPELLSAGADALLAEGGDAVLGPAADGGYWALGLRKPDEGLVRGVPMSTNRTGIEQLRRLWGNGLRVVTLPTLTDVDTIEDARRVAEAAPLSRFARALGAVAGRPIRTPVAS